MSNFGKVMHEKPDLALLKKRGFTAVDMHFHSRYSDGVNNVTSILKKAKRLGIGVGITDHNQIKGSVIASHNKDVLSIPGIEVTAKEGCHLLFYFYKTGELDKFYAHEVKHKKRKTSPFLKTKTEDLIERSKKYNCISIIPHPFAVTWTGLMNCVRNGIISKDIVKRFDGFEAITGSNQRIPNKRSIELALKMKGKMITGGSDGHISYELGHTVTFAKENITNPNDFLEAVVKRKCLVVGKETKFLKKYLAHSTKGKNSYKYTFNYLGKYFKYGKHKIKTKMSP